MYKAKINREHELNVSPEFKKNTVTINGKNCSIEILERRRDTVVVNLNGKIIECLILNSNPIEKSFVLKINQNRYRISLKDKYDELLNNLGMDVSFSNKHKNIKAPMPGMVLKLIAHEGSAVKKGDPLIILEAMKMENILKSPVDATIKKISVEKGKSVEKNQVLIEFS